MNPVLHSNTPGALQPLAQLHASLAQRFDICEEEIPLGGTTITILRVRDTNKLVDALRPEEFAVDERLPYWADIWTSSLDLARFCLDEKSIAGKRILELGCGLGLSGIAAAAAGGCVTLSDYEQDALDFARYNSMRNLPPDVLNRNVNFLLLDWRNLPDIKAFDMIIAADVVYERRNFFPLIDVFTSLLKSTGRAVITEPGRAIGDQFFQMLDENGFDLDITHHDVERKGKRSSVRRVIIRKKSHG